MNKLEFKKLLVENDTFWLSLSPSQKISAPLLQLSLWMRHANRVGCYMTRAQELKAKAIMIVLKAEAKRWHEAPRIHYTPSLAFIQAKALLNELRGRWFPATVCRVIEFRRSNATGSDGISDTRGDTGVGGRNAPLSD